MKRFVARALLRWNLPRFLSDPNPFNRLMGHAIELQLGRTADETFRLRLEEYYQHLEPVSLKRDIDVEAKIKDLDRPGGYKADILAIDGPTTSMKTPRRFDIWGRRFGLLRRLGIRSDVLILREGEVIPPHGHCRVVSGFYLLEGQVAIRHYDRLREVGDKLLIRKVLDTDLGPGGFTTNSEFFQNIHWLQGLADRSYLFRVTVTDTPVQAWSGDNRGSNSRLYLDPTKEPDESMMISAPYVTEEFAKRLLIRPCQIK
jgi:hypothetical protein